MTAGWLFAFSSAVVVALLVFSVVAQAFPNNSPPSSFRVRGVVPTSNSHGVRSSKSRHFAAAPSSFFTTASSSKVLSVEDEIGRGSYGIVHLCTAEVVVVVDDDDKEHNKHPPTQPAESSRRSLIGKRAYRLDELERQAAFASSSSNNTNKSYGGGGSSSGKGQPPKERLKRCQYYFDVEKHCMEKLAQCKCVGCNDDDDSSSSTTSTTESLSLTSSAVPSQVPTYRGIRVDDNGNEWMTFDVIGCSSNSSDDDDIKPCPTLAQVMDADWKVQHEGQDHHLTKLQQALGLTTLTDGVHDVNDDEEEEDDSCFSSTLDSVITSLLQVLCYIHDTAKIVHRDVKPANLLVDSRTHSLVLIDFGSAADMEPSSPSTTSKNAFGFGGALRRSFARRRVGLEDGNRVAVSPIYSAPELFIDPEKAPFQFDVFSAALIVCQLLFNYLDERTDAGFHQQLEDANWDLDVWLSRELGSKVRPAGLEEALDYLAARRGLWRLLGDMLRKNPEQRVSSRDALRRWQVLQTSPSDASSGVEDDGDDAAPRSMISDGPFFESVVTLMEECQVPPTVQRPLHFVATFRRNVPLGLILSESKDPTCKDPDWIEATKDAESGEVFVQRILPGCQADQMGIFEVGDRLQGVGELPLGNRGFERVLKMLEQQPKGAKFVKLHFDRQAARRIESSSSSKKAGAAESHVKVVAQGAWSSKGRRKAQEDNFVLHEIHEDQDILLAGCFDGHGGTAASDAAFQMVPYLMSEILRQQTDHGHDDVRHALEVAWEKTCDTYRHGCLDDDCVAEYDPVEGVLEANTGSTDLVSGTTASLVAVQEGAMTVLNCGDSRSLLIDGSDGKVLFSTQDHSPDAEVDRLNSDPFYSTPQCSLSKWYLSVGDYQYAVARSLEGPFATSKGIVSDPDITSIPTTEDGIVVVATDGLFEVMGNDEVGRDVVRFRARGDSAADAAKTLCSLALEKGTTDNVSVVVIYLGSSS